MTPELEPKQRILDATAALLREERAVDGITIRQIAERAEVGVGLINYHFQSKDNLLLQAVLQVMEGWTEQWDRYLRQAAGDPVTKLKMLFRETSAFVARYPKLSRVPISHDLLHGDMRTPTLILPVLREILPDKEERALRLIALQLVATMQVIFLRASTFRIYAGIDMFDERQREEALDMIVDHLVNPQRSVIK